MVADKQIKKKIAKAITDSVYCCRDSVRYWFLRVYV